MPEVDPYAANAAAMSRVHRLTDALVGAEAQVIELQRRLHEWQAAQEAERERTEAWKAKYESARDRGTRWRRRYVDAVKGTADRDQEELDQEAEEVGGNGTATCGDAETIGETVRPDDVPKERLGLQAG